VPSALASRSGLVWRTRESGRRAGNENSQHSSQKSRGRVQKKTVRFFTQGQDGDKSHSRTHRCSALKWPWPTGYLACLTLDLAYFTQWLRVAYNRIKKRDWFPLTSKHMQNILLKDFKIPLFEFLPKNSK
jgi:hypothetical protein